MYESHFKFLKRPFVAAPQVEYYVALPGIEQARQTLIRCVERAEGPGLIIGAAGSGKSLLCQLLVHHFREQRFQAATLASALLSSPRALLQSILFELNLPYRGMEEAELRLSLIDHLEPRGSGLAGLILVVDEAHTLPLKLLEEVRLISNFIRDGQPRVRLVLAGSPQLEERLASPKLESLQQRIAARCYLQPLSREETAQYVRDHVQRAGGNPDALFTADALKAIFAATDGVPRLVNQVCDHVLVLAVVGGHAQIGAEAVQEAWADLQQLPATWQTSQRGAAEEETVIEFGELPDEDSTVVTFSAEPSSACVEIELHETELLHTDAQSRACDNLNRIDSSLGALDTAEEITFGSLGDALDDVMEFEPVDSIETQVELAFDGSENPFGDEFDEEEIVIDKNASLTAESPSSVAGMTDESSAIAEQIRQLARCAAAAAARPATDLAAVSPRLLQPKEHEPEVSEPLRVHVADEPFNPASDPVLPEEAGTPKRGRRETAGGGISRPKRREYRTLFSTLRSR